MYAHVHMCMCVRKSESAGGGLCGLYQWPLYPRAATTYHTLRAQTAEIYCLHPGGWKSKAEVSTGLASPAALLLRCGWSCSFYPHMVCLCALNVFPLRGHWSHWTRLPSWPHFPLIPSLKALSPSTAIASVLAVKPSTHEYLCGRHSPAPKE